MRRATLNPINTKAAAAESINQTASAEPLAVSHSDRPAGRRPSERYIPVYHIELVRERHIDVEPRPAIHNSDDVVAILREEFLKSDREKLVALMLNAKNVVIGMNVISVGSLTSSIAHPRLCSQEHKRQRTSRTRTVPISGEIYQALQDQRQRFVEKFGREPGPNDPLFFDPNADTPQEISEEMLRNEMLKALAAAGVDPAVVYAYNKTGLLVSEENVHLLGAEELAEWQHAVEEAKQLFRTNKV